jgi:alpha-glucoside transport system permease protein
MKIFDIVYVMTNGDFNTNVVGVQFFNELFTNDDNGKAAAIVVILMIAIVPVVIYQVRHFRAEEASR